MAPGGRAVRARALRRCRCRAPASCRARRRRSASPGAARAARAPRPSACRRCRSRSPSASSRVARKSSRISTARSCASARRRWPRSRTGARRTSRARAASSRGLGEHAAALLRRRRQHDPRAEEAHQPAPLDAEVLGHGHDERDSPSRRTPSRARCRCCRWWPRSPSGPGCSAPSRSASSMTPSASRSLTEPIGLNASSLT